MSKRRIGGKDFYINYGDTMIHVESATLTISDNRAVAMTRGVPNGYVDGDTTCSGELELDAQNFKLVTAQARKAGSYKEIKPFDMMFFAEADGLSEKIEAFDCLPKVSDLVNIDPNGKDKTKHKVPFDVTGTDFVRIDGVPYLADHETNDLLF